jgi:hypothetical protein
MTSLVHHPAPASASANAPLYECHTVVMSRPAYLGLIGGGPDLLDEARARLAELESKWGGGGDIDRLNARPGVVLPASGDTVLLAALASEPVSPRRYVRAAEPGLLVDARHGTVGRLTDAPVDLTDLAAALAVDLVVSDLVDAGVAGMCVTIGPNARAVGASPPSGDWLVSVDGQRRPLRGRAIALAGTASALAGVAAAPAGVASASPGVAVSPAGVAPAPTGVASAPTGVASALTGVASAPAGVASVTVVADQAWRAHLLATAALALPIDLASALLRDTATAARLTTPDGTVHLVGGWDTTYS